MGNVNNFPFILARGLRHLGYKVTFLIDSPRQLDRPEFKYPSITIPYPDWIRDVGELSISVRPEAIWKWINVWWTLRQADLLFLNGFGLRFGSLLRKPIIAVLTGTDIDFYGNRASEYRAPPELPFWKQRLAQLIHRITVGLVRSGIRASTFVWTAKKGLLPATDKRLEELGIYEERRLHGFLVDVDEHAYKAPTSDTHGVRIFNVARFVWHEPLPYWVDAAENKRNDILIRGLWLLFKKHPALAVEVIFVRKGVELEHTYSLILGLGLEGKITWIDELTQIRFYEEVSKSDIVTDQFGDHLVSMGGYEAMQLGRPLVANGRLVDMQEICGLRPPVVQAATEEEVCKQLEFLIFNPRERLEIGQRSREFVLQHFSPVRKAREALERLGYRVAEDR